MKKFLLSILFIAVVYISNSQIVITEIMYNPPEAGLDSLEYIEIYNGYRANINFKGYHFSAGVMYTFGDTTVVGGTSIVVAVRSSAMKNVFGLDALQWTSGGLRNSGESIVLVDSNGMVLDSVSYSPSGAWPLEASGGGHSLELCNIGVDNSQARFWKASNRETKVMINGKQLFGSPGVFNTVTCSDFIVEAKNIVFEPAELTIKVGQTVEWQNKEGRHNVNGKRDVYPDNPDDFYSGIPMKGDWTYSFRFDSVGDYQYQCDAHVLNGMVGVIHVVRDQAPDLVINEIMYNPPGNSDDSLEYIELYNASDKGINLSGIHFTAGIEGQLPEVVLPADGYLIVAKDSAAFMNVFGVPAIQWRFGSLNNTSETIELSTELNTVIDKVTYSDKGDWPTEADGNGYALVLCDPVSDNAEAVAWGTEEEPLGIDIAGRDIYASPGKKNKCDQTQKEIPLYTIDQIRNVDVEGLPDSMGVKCRVRGVVYGVDLQKSDRVQFTLYDKSVQTGIGVFGVSGSGYEVQEGDSLEIEGEVGFFNGVTQIVLSGVEVIQQGRPLVDPMDVDSLGEYTESKLIRLQKVRLVDPSQWRGNGRFFTVKITNGVREFTLYIDDAVELSTMSAPEGLLNITGIGSQFDNRSPYTSGYQLSPRYAKDIEIIQSTQRGKDLQSITLYPNPANDYFLIREDNLIRNVKVFNSTGGKLFDGVPSFGRVYTRSWPRGAYLVQILHKNGNRHFRMLVLQ